MIYLTFKHGRNILKNGQPQKWLTDLFPKTLNFEGFDSGWYYPTISVGIQEFEIAKDKIPTKNLVRIQGKFTLLEQMAFGVRPFSNSLIEGELDFIGESKCLNLSVSF